MTQQPYYPPQYPQAPQPPPQQAYPPQVQGAYPPQAYAQPQQYAPPAPPQAPQQPLAQGTIDDFYNQPSVGGGPSISWTNKDGSQKPIGTAYIGIVARDVTQSDIQQETDFRTQQPKTYRDGRPKFVMKVPLKVQPSQEFTDGEAAFYVKGQARDELVRAMAEAGCQGAPTAGSVIQVTLVQRKPMGQGMNPANIVQVQYQPAQRAPSGAAAIPAAQPAQGTVAPSPAPVPQQVQQYEQVPQVQQQYQQPPAQPAPPAAPVAAPAQPAPQAAAPAMPVSMPEGFNADQQALLAKILGQQQAGQPSA